MHTYRQGVGCLTRLDAAFYIFEWFQQNPSQCPLGKIASFGLSLDLSHTHKQPTALLILCSPYFSHNLRSFTPTRVHARAVKRDRRALLSHCWVGRALKEVYVGEREITLHYDFSVLPLSSQLTLTFCMSSIIEIHTRLSVMYIVGLSLPVYVTRSSPPLGIRHQLNHQAFCCRPVPIAIPQAAA